MRFAALLPVLLLVTVPARCEIIRVNPQGTGLRLRPARRDGGRQLGSSQAPLSMINNAL
jgi:hypothetical protein